MSMTDEGRPIWCESGGSGSATVLLLHGVGATAAVWNGVRGALAQRGMLRWLAPDMSGHGASQWRPTYSVGCLAAALAPLLQGCEPTFVVGHSLGAYVGLALASGWFGVRIQGVLGIGPKITWSGPELQTARELAARPVRWYASADEAVARYRRVSGLTSDIAPGEEVLARGIVKTEHGWRLAQDPRAFAAAGAPFASLSASAAAPVILARGEHDPMVSTPELQRHAARVHSIAGAGHNAHVERPAQVAALLESLIALGGSPDH
jgi:pimeloyl-ACP methyl ester carboxylesterase